MLDDVGAYIGNSKFFLESKNSFNFLARISRDVICIRNDGPGGFLLTG
jgi:hypothetical protein